MRRNYTRTRRPMRRVVNELEDELRQARRLHDLVERLDEITHDVTQELLDQDYEDDDDEEEEIIDDDVDDDEEGDEDAIYEEVPRRSNLEEELEDEEVLVD